MGEQWNFLSQLIPLLISPFPLRGAVLPLHHILPCPLTTLFPLWYPAKRSTPAPLFFAVPAHCCTLARVIFSPPFRFSLCSVMLKGGTRWFRVQEPGRVIVFSALTLLVGRQEGPPACKKTERCGTGVVVCLEWGADLHIAQRIPLPLTVSCFSKIQIGFTFLVPAHPGSPRQRAVKWVCESQGDYRGPPATQC